MSAPSVVLPERETLKAITPGCRHLTVVTPYYSAGGLRLLEHAIQKTSVQKISFWCHLEVGDWIQEAIDPRALLDFIRRYDRRIEVFIAYSSLLHAKVYLSERVGLVGSANLTAQGFGSGLELLMLISGRAAAELYTLLYKEIYPQLIVCTTEQLAHFVSRNQSYVDLKRRQLRRVHRSVSRRARGLLSDAVAQDHWKFLDFCAKTGGKAANEVVDRGLGKDNLSGHIRSFYYASQQFLATRPKAVAQLSRLDPESFRLGTSPLLKTWKAFLAHDGLQNMPEVGYVAEGTFRYLPTYAGGKQTSGGAGIGNLNRVLPLVARFRTHSD